MIKSHAGRVKLRYRFDEMFQYLSKGELKLLTSVGTSFTARAAVTRDGRSVIRFFQRKKEYGRCYECCWGHYYNCNRTRIGMYMKALDRAINSEDYETGRLTQPIIKKSSMRSEEMEKKDILFWAKKYDKEHPWWVEKEKEIGSTLREKEQLTEDILYSIVEWKFKELPGRMKRIMKLVKENKESIIRRLSSQAFSVENDYVRVKLLCSLRGVGVSISSTILSFYNPKDYGVFDIHVWRELFGKEPTDLFTNKRRYISLLSELRKISRQYDLDVRTVEKALFKKNYDKSRM